MTRRSLNGGGPLFCSSDIEESFVNPLPVCVLVKFGVDLLNF